MGSWKTACRISRGLLRNERRGHQTGADTRRVGYPGVGYVGEHT